MNKITAGRHASFGREDAKKIVEVLNQHFPFGGLTAKKVLEFARPKYSPLHQYFEWDDSVAAEKYRLLQARRIIISIEVEIEGIKYRKYTTPVFIEETGQRSYVDISIARKSPEIWNQILQIALDEITLWKTKYEHLIQLKPIMKAIKRTEKSVRSKKRGKK